MQFPGALYHVLNRGNYQQDLFTTHRTGEAFERTLFEACERFGWRLHAYVLMSNHFHLALETPRGNLVRGMQWLESVFANRFNRFSGGRGHVFQGRYKALLIEPGASLRRVVDYIHLNPVRAGLVELGNLRSYPRSSFPHWFAPERPAGLDDSLWRAQGGYGPGEAELNRYWVDLASRREGDPKLAEELRRDLCRGWLIGGPGFLESLLGGTVEVSELDRVARTMERDAVETEELWSTLLDRLLSARSRNRLELATARKSAPWKLEIAHDMKRTTGASNRWLAQSLNLGTPEAFSSNLSKWRKSINYVA